MTESSFWAVLAQAERRLWTEPAPWSALMHKNKTSFLSFGWFSYSSSASASNVSLKFGGLSHDSGLNTSVKASAAVPVPLTWPLLFQWEALSRWQPRREGFRFASSWDRPPRPAPWDSSRDLILFLINERLTGLLRAWAVEPAVWAVPHQPVFAVQDQDRT